MADGGDTVMNEEVVEGETTAMSEELLVDGGTTVMNEEVADDDARATTARALEAKLLRRIYGNSC